MRTRGMAFIGLALFLSAIYASAAPPAAAPAATMPTATMPDSVYKTLKAAVEAHEFSRDAGNRAANLRALEGLRQASWPDYSKLRLVRVYAADNTPAGLAWCVSLTPTEMTYVADERTLATLDRSKAGKIEDADYGGALEALVRYLKSTQMEDWQPAVFGLIRDDGAHGLAGVTSQDHAIAAAWRGWNDRAAAIVDLNLRRRETALVDMVDGRTWPSLSKGVEMLQTKRADRAAVLEVWQATLAANPGSGYEEQLQDMIAQLKIQAGEDALRAKAVAVDPAKLPVEEQIRYYVDRLCETNGEQDSDPGECPVLGWGPRTEFSDALVKIGRPAVPALIALLDDRRLTRCVGYFRTFDQHPHVLRYQDVAIKCIEAIVDIRFYISSGSGFYLSKEKKETHDAVVADVRSWWTGHGMETAVKGQIARLEVGTINDRIETLRKIEKMDPTAVNPIAILRSWSITARITDAENRDWVLIGRDLPRIAEELALHNNFEVLPEMRRLANKSDLAAMEYLVHWGVTEDFQFLRVRLRQAIAAELAGIVSDENMVIYEVGGEIKACKSPLAVPVMVECLAYRERNGLMGTPQGGVNFGIADECMEQLILLTGHNEGFVFTDAPGVRDAAFDKWLAWWKGQGEAAYVGTHPEVGKMLAPATNSAP